MRKKSSPQKKKMDTSSKEKKTVKGRLIWEKRKLVSQ